MGSDAIATARPDLAIVDLSLGHGDGLELVREIRTRHAGLRVLVLTMHDAPEYVRRAFAAGADGCVSKQELTETLLMAIRSVLRGETYAAPRGLMRALRLGSCGGLTARCSARRSARLRGHGGKSALRVSSTVTH